MKNDETPMCANLERNWMCEEHTTQREDWQRRMVCDEDGYCNIDCMGERCGAWCPEETV